MPFLNYSFRLLRDKQLNLDIQELEGIWYVQFPLENSEFIRDFIPVSIELVCCGVCC